MKETPYQVHTITLDETVSTNSFLADYRPSTSSDITLVTAEYQTAGRGQAGNSWEAQRGANLLFSILVQPTALPADRLFVLSEAIALGIQESLATLLRGYEVTVKWPNDIYVGDSKIAGILIENSLQGTHVRRAVLGCGVNVNQSAFAFTLSAQRTDDTPAAHRAEGASTHSTPTPVSLRQLLGHDTDRHALLQAILDAFLRRYALIQEGDSLAAIHAEYLAALYRRTGFHPYRDSEGTFMAEIADVEPTGHIVLSDNDGRLRSYAFKQLTYL